MKKIFKYQIPGAYGTYPIEIPVGAQLLDVGPQESGPVVWAVVDPEAPLEIRQIVLTGTGHELPEGALIPIGSFQFPNPHTVWHAFELVGVGQAVN